MSERYTITRDVVDQSLTVSLSRCMGGGTEKKIYQIITQRRAHTLSTSMAVCTSVSAGKLGKAMRVFHYRPGRKLRVVWD